MIGQFQRNLVQIKDQVPVKLEDNWVIVKKGLDVLKIFFASTTWLISIKHDTKHFWGKSFRWNERPGPLQREDN